MEHSETEGQAAQTETQWPGLWDDLASVKALAAQALGHPSTSRLAMAMTALCQVVENLAQRVEALENPKPCEGCSGFDEAVEQVALSESLDRLDKRSAPQERGALRRALEVVGIVKGGA